MMKLGLHTAILPDYSFEQVVDYAARTGFKGLEVCCWPNEKATRRYAGVSHIDVEDMTEEKAKKYVEYAEKKGITIATLAYFPNPLSDDEETAKKSQEHLIKVIDAAALMNVNLVTTFIGKNKTKTVEENLELMERVWIPILKHAEEKHVRIAIENCPMYFTKDEWPGGNNLASTPQVWRRMFEMSPNIGLCFDPSHMILLGMNVWKPVVDFADRIYHIHFKDLQIDQEKVEEYGRFSYPGLWHTPKLPGYGDIDFPKLITKLHETGFKGYACLECEDRAFEGSVEDVRNGIEIAYRYLHTYL